VLIVSAIAIFAQLDSAFDRIWKLPADPHATWLDWMGKLVFQRLKALGMLVGVGGFVVLVMMTTMIWSSVERAMEPLAELRLWLRWSSSLTLNLLMTWIAMTMIYRVVPKQTIRWWDAFRGGLLAALLWEAGRQVLAAYMLHLNYPTAYGIIGSFIVVMLWAYYAALVLLFGAEYVRVVEEERQTREFGVGDATQ
jgi:membrane protein